MEDKRREVLFQLSVMLEYANLTEKAKETVQSAIDILEKDKDAEAERLFAGKVSVLFGRLYDELDKWKAQNKKDEQAEEFQARILTDDELRMVEKPIMLWREEPGSERTEQQELLYIEDELVDDEGNPVEALQFENGWDPMNLNRKTYRYWNRKPTAEEMRAEPWPEA